MSKTPKELEFHCNYCRRDITKEPRVKCVECPNFDLCLDCFSIGAELQPHKNTHAYRIVDNLRFPVFDDTSWSADEEILLLESIHIYGIGNWKAVGDHLGTKSAEECRLHYLEYYIEHERGPNPDMTRMLSAATQLAFAHGDIQIHKKRGPPRDRHDLGSAADKRKRDDAPAHRNTNVNALPAPGSYEGQVGFNPKRRDFDVEYDNRAEELVALMHFRDEDTPEDLSSKLGVLYSYNIRLAERLARKEFLVNRGLLNYRTYIQRYKRTPEEHALYHKLLPFMRIMPPKEWEDLVDSLFMELRLRKDIEELQQLRRNGIQTHEDEKRYWRMLKQREKRRPLSAANSTLTSSQPVTIDDDDEDSSSYAT